MEQRKMVSALVSRGYIKNGPAIVLALYGERGGTFATCEMTVGEASLLRAQLTTAIAELSAVEDAL